MNETSEKFSQELHDLLVSMANDGFYNAARGISGMVGEDLQVSEPSVGLVPINDIPVLLGGPENEAVGIYLRAEVGNLTGTFFLNAMARLANTDIRPSPPAVMVDMIGAVLDILLATTAGLSENVLMMQATFTRKCREARVDFWVIPDRTTLEAILRRGSEENG